MSTKLNELSSYITRLVYLDIARGGGDFVDAIADVLTPMGFTVTANEHYVDLVAAAKREAEPVLEKSVLFSTFITNEEILDWEIYKEEIRSALADEAYGRWFNSADKEAAEFHADCWTVTVAVLPFGYYVQIGGEPDLETMVPITIHPVSLERCHELAADLESIEQAISALGVDEWPVIAHLDEQHSTAMDDLANEMLALLMSNNLIGDNDA